MSRLKSFFLCFVVAVVVALGFEAGSSQTTLSNLKSFVLSSDSAYVALKPEPVAGNRSERLLWSSDGSHLLVIRTDVGEESRIRDAVARQPGTADVEQSLISYRLADRKSIVLWKSRASAAHLDGVKWFTGSNRCVASVTEPLRTEDPRQPGRSRQSILIFDADKGTSTSPLVVQQEGGFPVVDVEESPVKPYALVGAAMRGQQVVAGGSVPPERALDFGILHENGSMSRLSVPPALNWDGWNADGSAPVFMSFDRDPGRKPTVSYYQADLTAGSVRKLEKPSAWRPDRAWKDVTAMLDRTSLAGSKPEVRVRSAWLFGSADATKTIIAADCTAVSMSPALNAVAYISDGVALVRPILRLPKSAFLAALIEAQREQIMQNAKQVGTASLMYGADADDQLPLKDMDLADILGPYAKDKGIFDGFVYTYGGGALSGLKDPSKTELGFIQGPGGRAILYADGHVQWVADK